MSIIDLIATMSIIDIIATIICIVLFVLAYDTISTKTEQERDGYAKYTYNEKEDTNDHNQNDKG